MMIVYLFFRKMTKSLTWYINDTKTIAYPIAIGANATAAIGDDANGPASLTSRITATR